MDEGVSNEELLLLAASAGYEVGARMLADWHRDGLLPRPRQVSLGQGHGSVSVYPREAADQLLALCHLRFDEHRKLTRDIGWRLWWQGFSVDMDLVRRVLADAAEQGDALAGADLGTMEEAAEMLSSARSTPRTRLISQARRQRAVGRELYGAFVRTLLRTLNRQGPDTPHPKDAALLEEGLSLAPARTRGISDDPVQLVAGEVRFLMAESFTDLLGRQSDDDLVRLRDELVPVFDGVDLLGRLAKRVGPRTGFAARLARPADMRGEAMWLLLWARSSERPGLAKDETPPARAAQMLGDVTRLYRLIRLLRERVPAFADLLTTKNLTRAAVDPRYRERLQGYVAIIAKKNSAALKAAFEDDPEAMALLDWPAEEEAATDST